MSYDDQQPPWGKKKGPSSPEEFIAALLKKIKDGFEGKGGDSGEPSTGPQFRAPENFSSSIGKIAGIIVVLGLVTLVMACFYTVKPGERGVVLRFGKYSSTANPGLNFKIPLIDAVSKVDVEYVHKEEFGFRTRIPGQQTVYDKRGYDTESLMLTADKNVIDVEWIVQYKVHDPVQYLFKVVDVRQSVQDISQTAIRRIIGNMDFDFVLSNREILAASTAREVQDSLDKYESGVKIVTVQLQDVNPPEQVKPAFNEVNEADQDMKRLVNEAQEAYNRVIPKARGEAKKIFEEAHGYSIARVNIAKGETARFNQVLTEYAKAKDVTRQRLYLETMEKVLPKINDVYVIDKDQNGILPLLNLNSGSAQQSGSGK